MNPAPRVATGITLSAPDGTHTVTAATVTAHEINDTYDLIIITVKARALAAVVDDIARAVGATTTIVPFLNGMLHIDSLEARYPDAWRAASSRSLPHSTSTAGAIQANGMADVIVGPLGQTPRSRRSAPRLMCRDLPRAPAMTPHRTSGRSGLLSPQPVSSPAFTNSVGAVRAAGGPHLHHRCHRRTVAVAAAAGHPPREESVAWTTTVLTEEGSPLTSSLFRDLTAGLPTEGEQIGRPAERARRPGVSTPLLDLAVVRVRAAELSRRAASWTHYTSTPIQSTGGSEYRWVILMYIVRIIPCVPRTFENGEPMNESSTRSLVSLMATATSPIFCASRCGCTRAPRV